MPLRNSSGVYSPTSSSTVPDCEMRPVRSYSEPRNSRSSAKSRSIFALSTTTMAGSSSSVFRTISDTRGASPSGRQPQQVTQVNVLDPGPQGPRVEEAELLQVPDQLGMRLGHRRVVDALVLGGAIGEACLLGQDRLAGAWCTCHHHYRPRPSPPLSNRSSPATPVVVRFNSDHDLLLSARHPRPRAGGASHTVWARSRPRRPQDGYPHSRPEPGCAPWPGYPQAADKLRAVHDRHHHVGHHQIRCRLPHGLQRCGAISGIAHFMPGPLEDPPEQKPLVRFVIDHQNPRHAALYPSEINYLA